MHDWTTEVVGAVLSLEYGAGLREEARRGSTYPVFGSNGEVGRHSRALVKGPGIIVGRKGSAGALAWTDEDFWPIDTTYWVKPRRNLHLRWLFAALDGMRLETLEASTGVPGLNRSDVYMLEIVLPALDEQQRIAEILDTIDEAIQTSERAIGKLQDVEKGLRHRLLVGEASRDGAEYELVRLCVAIVDCPHSTPNYRTDGVLVARTMDIKDGVFREDEASRVSEADYQSRVARMPVMPGDVIFTREAPVGEAFAVPEGMRVCMGQRLVQLRPGPLLDSDYLLGLIYSDQIQRQVRQLTAGTTNPHLNVAQLRSLRVRIPRVEAQGKAVEALGAVRQRIESERCLAEKLRGARKGLASDLLSGRVRTVAS